jgi:hypothetical protein
MKTVILLGIILLASISNAADTQATMDVTTLGPSALTNERAAIEKKCAALGQPNGHDACVKQDAPLLKIASSIDRSLDKAKLSNEQRQQLITTCEFNPATDDVNALTGHQNCIKDKLRLWDLSNGPATLSQDLGDFSPRVEMVGPPPVFAGEPPAPPAGQPDGRVGKGTLPPANANPAGLTDGEHVGSSVYLTPSACLTETPGPDNGLVIAHPELIGVRRELLAPKEASDVYGHRLGKRYIIYQVRISDYSKDYQYVVHDISLNLRNVLLSQLTGSQRTSAKGLRPSAFLASSRDLDVLRGVPEKGQDYDPRNLTLHILTGLGSVAGGVSGLTAFSDVMGSAVSVFNGAFLQAFVGILPDHTATQLNRLSDHSFASNTLVDKLHTKVFAIFIPQSLVLSASNQKTFWSKPRDLLNGVPLDQVDVCVDGSLVTEVTITPDPTIAIDSGLPTTPDSTTSGIDIAPGTPISIQDSASDAAVYYTDVAGTTPSATSTKYAGPITYKLTDAGASKIVRAIAISPNKAQSNIVSQTYTIQKMPLIEFIPGSAGVNPTLKITAADPTNDSIYYTTKADGTTPQTPTTADTLYSSPIPLPSSTNIKAIEVPKAGAAPASPPVASYKYTAK